MASKKNITSTIAEVVHILLKKDPDYKRVILKKENNAVADNLKRRYTSTVLQELDSSYEILKDTWPQDINFPKNAKSLIATMMLDEVEENGVTGLKSLKENPQNLVMVLSGKSNVVDLDDLPISDSEFKMPFEEIGTPIDVFVELKKDIMPKIFKKAHEPNATKEVKEYAAALIANNGMEENSKYGITFKDYDLKNRGWIIAGINAARASGEIDFAKKQMALYGIDEKELVKEEYKNFKYEDNTKDEKDSEESSEINRIANKIFTLNTQKLTPENYEELRLEIEDLLSNSDLNFDALMQVFAQNELDLTKDINKMMIKKASIMLEENKNIRCDGWLTANTYSTIRKIEKENPELAKKILEGYNEKLPESERRFTLEELKSIPESKWNSMILHMEREKDGANLYNEAGIGYVSNQIQLEFEISKNDFGSFSEKLSGIAHNILSNEIANGISVSDELINSITTSVRLAYQEILTIANDQESIQESISLLEQEVAAGNCNINGRASKIALKAVETIEFRRRDEIANPISKKMAETGKNAEEIDEKANLDGETTVDIDKIFNEAVTEKVENLLEKIKNGDFKALVALEVLTHATEFSTKNQDLNEKNLPEALIVIKRMMVTNSSTCNEAMENIIKQWKLDLLEKDANGNTIINQKGFQEMFKRYCPEIADKSDEYFIDMNNSDTEKAINDGKYDKIMSMTPEEIVRLQKEEVEKTKMKEDIAAIVKTGRFDGIKVLANKNKTIFVSAVKEFLENPEKTITERKYLDFLTDGKLMAAFNGALNSTIENHMSSRIVYNLSIGNEDNNIQPFDVRSALKNSKSLRALYENSYDYKKEDTITSGDEPEGP